MADPSSSEEDEQLSLIQRAVSTALVPVHIATSRPAIKTYLSAFLFLLASCILLSLSTAAYLFFYYNYIPQIDLSRVIYLQYGVGPYPHAIVLLDTSALVSQQPYDISIKLHIPRTPTNLAVGNFMLDLSLLTESADVVPSKVASLLPHTASLLPYTTLATSRRPAILPYASPLLSLANTLVSLPWHILSFRDLDAHQLTIPMFEHYSFARGSGSKIPKAIRLELQSEQVLQIYSARIVFQAKFEGLRYLIYNYRILSFLLFSAIFYFVTLVSFGIAWVLVSLLFPSSTGKKDTVKKEQREGSQRIKNEPTDESQLSNGQLKTEATDKGKEKASPEKALLESDSESDHGLSLSNLSDSAATFPGIGRQMPLRMPLRGISSGSFGRSGRVSLRGSGGGEDLAEEVEPEIKAEDVADDEDEDDEVEEEQKYEEGSRGRDFDSGIGTSMESENTAAAGALSRRRSSRGLSGAAQGRPEEE